MTVTYDSYLAKVVEYAITMLAGSATFRTLVAAASPTAAKSWIVESWGGDPATAGLAGKAKAVDGTAFVAVPPFAHVHSPGMDPASAGIGVFTYTGEVFIGLLQARKLTGETPAEQFRRARNIGDAIRAEIQAQFGGTGVLAQGVVTIDGPEMPDATSADGDALLVNLVISWEG